jgi:hypothetical protein
MGFGAAESGLDLTYKEVKGKRFWLLVFSLEKTRRELMLFPFALPLEKRQTASQMTNFLISISIHRDRTLQ